MSTTAENMLAITGRVSPEQVRDALMVEKVKAALYGTTNDVDMDDTWDWASAHRESLAVGFGDRYLAELAEQAEQEQHDRVVRESVWHFAQACQGRLPCREKCPVVELPEMACTAGEEPPLSHFTPFGKLAIAALLAVFVLGCWLAPLAG